MITEAELDAALDVMVYRVFERSGRRCGDVASLRYDLRDALTAAYFARIANEATADG